MREHRRFGQVSDDDERLKPEKHEGRASSDEVDATLAGYAALDQVTRGRYRDFLQAAAHCETCVHDPRVKGRRKPLPILCGTGGLDTSRETYERAHAALEPYRRTDRSLRVDVEGSDGTSELRALLAAHGLPGLSIGHCGWGDLTASLRGRQLGEGVDILILGADWYPLTQCSRFLLDRFSHRDATLTSFLRKLGVKTDVAEFIRQRKVYLGNTLLCYRGGFERQGRSNLSRRSFDNCRPHLARHIDALSPKIIVTFGCDAARSVAHLLEGETERDQNSLAQMRRDPKLAKIMEQHYGAASARGIAAHRGDSHLRFVPLYHPSMANSNKYEGDYDALRALLSEGA